MRVKSNAPPGNLTYKSKLWRYINLAKLISMVSKRQLHFTRVDKLDAIGKQCSPRTLDQQVAGLLNTREKEDLEGPHGWQRDCKTDGGIVGHADAG